MIKRFGGLLLALVVAACGGGSGAGNTTPEGDLLGGQPGDLALSLLISQVPVPADGNDIDNGVILTRLDVAFEGDATVGQVNAALESINGRIAGMEPGLPFLVVAVPPQEDLAALEALASELQSKPGILLAVPGRQASVNLAPSPPANGAGVMDHLNDARFPAAWNVQDLQGDCAVPVTLIVADFFRRPLPSNSVYQDFDLEVPGVVYLGSTTQPNPTAPSPDHGYAVLGTAVAALDDEIPTGANPFPGCLTIMAINIGGYSTTATTMAIQQAIPPAGKVVVNTSLGWDSCGTPCTPATLSTHKARERAMYGAHQRAVLADVEDRVLLSAAAGNEADDEISTIYPGMGLAPWSYAATIASRADSEFSFATNPGLWEPTVECPPTPCFPSLTMTDLERPRLQELLALLALTGAPAPGNILVVGAVDPATNRLTDYSDPGADLTAVGTVPTLEPDEFVQGTSFAAPQVAGLATYLWRISPELRAAPVADTISAILANTRGADSIIDAYATVLSLDPAGTPNAATWQIRRTLLDADNDNAFDEGDLEPFVERYFQAPAFVDEVNPATRDYSTYDLNGNGYTGGSRLESFDLDRTGSSRYGIPTLNTVELQVGTERLEIDENNATDLDILCWYAWSPLYQGDTDARERILAGRCFTISVVVAPTTVSVAPGNTVSFGADVSGTDNPLVTWVLPNGGGTVDGGGVFTAGQVPGTYTVRAVSVVDPNAFGDAEVTVSARACSGVTRRASRGEARTFGGTIGCVTSISAPFVLSSTVTSSCALEGVVPGTSTVTTSFTESYSGGELVAASTEISALATGANSGVNFSGRYFFDFQVAQTTSLTIEGAMGFDNSSGELRIIRANGEVLLQVFEPGPLDRVITLTPDAYVISLLLTGKFTAPDQGTASGSLRLSCPL